MWKILAGFALGLVVAAVAVFLVPAFFQGQGSSETGFVRRVIDGDTIVLASGARVRLLGIDAPEKDEHCFSEAGGFLEDLLAGNLAELVFDIEQVDKYSRKLAYVFAGGKFVNLELVREGFAVAFPFEPNMRYAEEFAVAEQMAREQQKGCLWAKD